MTNLELYIFFSYLVLLIPAIDSNKNKIGAFFVWVLSPIAFPMLLGIYLDKNFNK